MSMKVTLVTPVGFEYFLLQNLQIDDVYNRVSRVICGISNSWLAEVKFNDFAYYEELHFERKLKEKEY